VTFFFDIPPEYEERIDNLALRKNISLLLVELNISDSKAFTVAFMDDVAIQTINHQFRDVDTPTDVLSFPAEEVNPEDKTEYIGDILISMDTLERQSQEHHIAVLDELHLLVIHGLLHLLGYDHETEVQKSEMWQIQSRLLQLLHCPADPDQYYL
jgi:probable rRNA maturation factor